MGGDRDGLIGGLDGWRGRLVELCSRLVACDSRNPPGDTRAAAELVAGFLGGVPGVEVRRVAPDPTRVSVVARLAGGRPGGRRLVLNGHLDTGPVPEPESWSVPPLGGVVRDGRVYGRGVSDMKAGVAAQVLAVAALAPRRAMLAGELVLTLVADEGTGGRLGTRHLLATLPEAAGDAMLSGDVGSPRVARFGEKGFLWLELRAAGRAAGGAHVQLGVNAVDRLTDALARLRSLQAHACPLPADVRAAVDAAGPASEAINGAGETAALKRITVNVGRIEGGSRINQVPSAASALVDVRFPPGLAAEEVLAEARGLVAGVPGVEVAVIDGADPTWTPPTAEIVRLVGRNAAEVLGSPPALTLRAGFSDARFYRRRGVPAVGYGATAHNGNAPDEYATIEDLEAVFQVHALTAFDFLTSGG